MPRFVSEALVPGDAYVEGQPLGNGEPPLPQRFGWRDDGLVVERVVRAWRSTIDDRGDSYLARHWFELRLTDGRGAVIYFDRQAKRGRPRWWLYTIDEG